MSDDNAWAGIIPEHHCAVCGYAMNAVAPLGTCRLPQAGDLSICAMCLAIGVFQKDGTLRVATSEECMKVPEWVRERIAIVHLGQRPS